VQTIWEFDSFTTGYAVNYYQYYFDKLAKWKKLGDLLACDPTKKVDCTATQCEYDVSNRLTEYFSNEPGKLHDNKGWITRRLSEAAGFRLRWSLAPRCLKIEPGQWTKPAPLPETNPNDLLFWYCPTLWGSKKNTGGNLLVTPEGEKGQEFMYRGGLRAVLTHNMPHVLSAINKKAAEPYYCLYGQLQEA
jgi:hypothetical protein